MSLYFHIAKLELLNNEANRLCERLYPIVAAFEGDFPTNGKAREADPKQTDGFHGRFTTNINALGEKIDYLDQIISRLSVTVAGEQSEEGWGPATPPTPATPAWGR